ncbi:hypothetical protein D9757_011854 [Collybiopsis confluens]|uniref:DUF6534 domain-containing protein n=1 Tax=Collybiopsis confluens TaxID=2823264 RepID=A0A8H5D6A9_9AGAR|nr:hypothetical protein D9757_011854 [Collybiopsis confluens]
MLYRSTHHLVVPSYSAPYKALEWLTFWSTVFFFSMSDTTLLIGPMFIGAYLSAILFGVTLVQAHSYFTVYKNDRPAIRSLLIFLLLAETVKVGTDFAAIWEPLVTDNGSARALEISPIGIHADPMITSFISTAVQLFRAWQIRTFTASKVLPIILVFFAFASLVGGVSSTIFVSMAPAYSDFGRLNGPIYTWLISSAVADIIIAISMVIQLLKKKEGTSPKTETVIDRIIRMYVQTGALTSIAAIADLLTFAFSGSTIQFIWDFSLGKLYTISLLSSLNARPELRRLLNPEREGDPTLVHLEQLDIRP